MTFTAKTFNIRKFEDVSQIYADVAPEFLDFLRNFDIKKVRISNVNDSL